MPARIFVPSNGPGDWRRLLANPDRHWKREKSAFECAVSWESARQGARGIPTAIARALDTHSATSGTELLLAIPELQVDLPGGGHASQNDVWALLAGESGLVSLAVEAKSGESLGEIVSEWLAGAVASSGKPRRLEFLRECLGLQSGDVAELRYQLLHRAVSAILQARHFNAPTAVLLIQSFGGSSDDKSRDDYHRFAEAMGCSPAFNAVAEAGRPTTPTLLIGWVTDAPASDEMAARAL